MRQAQAQTAAYVEGTQQRGVNSRCFTNLSVANQLFAVLIRLRRVLESLDVCTKFKISETTYSRMFSTWILFLNQARAGRRPARTWFRIAFVREVSMRVCVSVWMCVCPPPRL